jgi:hypothetical protein
MKRLAVILGVILFVLGVVALLHPDFDYHKREELAKIGPVTATVEKPERTTVPPAAAAALLIAGAALIAVSTRLK